MKGIRSRERHGNHLEVIIRVNKKENGNVLERELRRAISKWKRSLDMGISYEILTIDDRNNDLAVKQWKMHDNVDRTIDAVCDWIQEQIKDDSICIEGGAVVKMTKALAELVAAVDGTLQRR